MIVVQSKINLLAQAR